MADRAPVLFGATGNLANVSHQSVEITAIETVKLFDDVEIGESVTIYKDVITPFDFGNLVDRKANPLIKTHKSIQDQCREQDRPDDGGTQQMQDRGGRQIAQ